MDSAPGVPDVLQGTAQPCSLGVEMRTGILVGQGAWGRSWMTKSINLSGIKSVPKSIHIRRSISA